MKIKIFILKKKLDKNLPIKKHLLNRKGLSLIEIMVALFLLSLAVLYAGSHTSSERDNLKEAMDEIERSLQLATNESILRGVIVRLQIDLDKFPIEYVVQYGPDGQFTLPSNEKSTVSTLEEEEEEKKSKSKIDKLFNDINEFSKGSKKFSDQVKILGIGTTLFGELQQTGQVSIYLYPTGEKDGSLIVLAAEREVATMTINPFYDEVIKEFKALDTNTNEDIEEEQQKLNKELYEEWQKVN